MQDDEYETLDNLTMNAGTTLNDYIDEIRDSVFPSDDDKSAYEQQEENQIEDEQDQESISNITQAETQVSLILNISNRWTTRWD